MAGVEAGHVRNIDIEDQEIIVGRNSTRGVPYCFRRNEDVDLPGEGRNRRVDVWFSKSSLGV